MGRLDSTFKPKLNEYHDSMTNLDPKAREVMINSFDGYEMLDDMRMEVYFKDGSNLFFDPKGGAGL